jgi:hypothetical protein
MEAFFIAYTVALASAVSAALIGSGIALSRRTLVTAREAMAWRHDVRKLGLDTKEDMPPALTDTFVLAWRRAAAGQLFGGGTGLIAGILVGLPLVLLVHTQTNWPSTVELQLVVLPCCGFLLGVNLGGLRGLRQSNRETDGADIHEYRISHRLFQYRPRFIAVYTALITGLIAGIYLFALWQSLLAGTESSALRSNILSAAPRGLAPFIVSAVCLVVVLATMLISVELTTQDIARLAPLRVPAPSLFGTQADIKLRSVVVMRNYAAYMGCACLLAFLLPIPQVGTTPGNISFALAVLVCITMQPFVAALAASAIGNSASAGTQ